MPVNYSDTGSGCGTESSCASASPPVVCVSGSTFAESPPPLIRVNFDMIHAMMPMIHSHNLPNIVLPYIILIIPLLRVIGMNPMK